MKLLISHKYCCFCFIVLTALFSIHLSIQAKEKSSADTNGEYTFNAIHQSTSETQSSIIGEEDPLRITMSFDSKTLTLTTTLHYEQYVHKKEIGGMMEFRYFKSCANNGKNPPTFSQVTNKEIMLVLYDIVDPSSVSYSFNMEKVELTKEEKTDIIFNVMKADIAELKDRLWFLDPSVNKLSKLKRLKIADDDLKKFLSGKSPIYSGLFLNPASHYNYPRPDFNNDYNPYDYQRRNRVVNTQSAKPISIGFPVRTSISKLQIELKQTSCSSSIFVKAYYIPYTIQSAKFEKINMTSTTTVLSDGFTRHNLIVKDPNVMGDLFEIYISDRNTEDGAQSYNPEGGNCAYELRLLKLF